jgi:phosphoglycolate phosphatase-like HAD superfamily hydrolase
VLYSLPMNTSYTPTEIGKKKKLVIFNANGPLADSFEHAFRFAQFQWPSILRDEYRAMFDKNIYDSIREFTLTERTPEEIAGYKNEIHRPTRMQCSLAPGMDELLEALRGKVIFTINTSGHLATTWSWLRHVGIEKHFVSVKATDQTKSKVVKFSMIQSELADLANDPLYITDKIGDAQESIRAGIPAILITWGFQNRAHLEEIKKDVVAIVDTPAELTEKILEYYTFAGW